MTTSNNTNVPQIFSYEEKQVRTFLDAEGNTWFVATDVCKILEIVNSRDALKGLDSDETMVSVIPTPSRGNQKMKLINESGLYNLIFRSNKPEAKKFKKWITSEVIPTIRKTGSYGMMIDDSWKEPFAALTEMVKMLALAVEGLVQANGKTAGPKRVKKAPEKNCDKPETFYHAYFTVKDYLQVMGHAITTGMTTWIGTVCGELCEEYSIKKINRPIANHPYLHNIGMYPSFVIDDALQMYEESRPFK